MKSMAKIILIVFFILTSGIACGDKTDKDKSSQSEVYQLGEISVSPGKFSIDANTPSVFLIPIFIGQSKHCPE
jgi:hypothetical protein